MGHWDAPPPVYNRVRTGPIITLAHVILWGPLIMFITLLTIVAWDSPTIKGARGCYIKSEFVHFHQYEALKGRNSNNFLACLADLIMALCYSIGCFVDNVLIGGACVQTFLFKIVFRPV